MFKIILALLLLASSPASAQYIAYSDSGGGGGGSGTVTSLSVVTGNGFAGTVANPTTTPAITLTTSITGNVCGNATALSACSTTGTGATVLANTPTLITPVLGVATGTSLALGGATIGTSALAVTGIAKISGLTQAGSWELSTNAIVPFASNGQDIGGTSNLVRNLYLGTSLIFASGADTTLSRNAAGVVQFGTTAANAAGAWLAAKGTLTGGTLADQARVLSVTATQPATIAATQSAVTWTITSAGSSNQENDAFTVNYNAGYTGANYTVAISAANLAAGTGAFGFIGSTGNYGVYSNAIVTTNGHNVGNAGNAQGGNVNIGNLGRAIATKNSAANIGVLGLGLNTGSSSVQVGGYFSLNQITVPTVSAALIADNGAQTDPIFLARDNGSTVFTIADGGAVSATGTVSSQDLNASRYVTLSGGSNGVIYWTGKTEIKGGITDGNILFWNTANTDFGLMQFGGTTSSFPAIKRSTTVLQFKLADDSAFTSFTATTGILNALTSDAGQTDTTVCADSTTGQLYKGSGTLGICLGTSSARYKNNIVNLNDGLLELTQLQPKRFWYNKDAGDNGAKEHVGFLAEDVAKVLPNLVGLDAEGRPNTLDMVGMIPIIIKAIQELKADNDNLRATLVRRAANGG